MEWVLYAQSNVLYTLRFMVDMGVVGGNWVELPPGGYQMRQKKASMCQLECDVLFDKVVSHPPEGQYSKLAPFRILSMDIECAGRRGHFPDAEHDPVIQIATMVTCQGDDKPIIKAIWTLDTCAPIVGADVLSFTDERELLRSWGKFLRSTDPDLLIGYNIVNFDFPYLINRAATLGVEDFPYWGRMVGSKLRMKDTTFSSKAYGTRDSKEITIEGRVQFDLLQAVQRDHKLSSYSLNAVSAHFLGEQKEDVHHSAISELQARGIGGLNPSRYTCIRLIRARVSKAQGYIYIFFFYFLLEVSVYTRMFFLCVCFFCSQTLVARGCVPVHHVNVVVCTVVRRWWREVVYQYTM